MMDDEIIRKLKNALRQRAAQDPGERFDDLVRRGVIDEKGKVLLRMPEPPKEPKKPKSTKARKPS